MTSDEVDVSLKQKIHTAARDGRAMTIFAMLWNLPRSIVSDVLEHQTVEDGQRTTPLIIAARNGEEKVVLVLLTNFNLDCEQTGTVKFDGFVIEGATALWCASGAGHFGIVKLLIEHGCDVNHATKTSSTPLRAACFDGRLDIVRFLVENGADFSIPNKYSNTCLMISCYKGHSEVARYLLEKGADPDCIAHCGATALHFASECGHLEIVQDIVKFGGKQIKNDHNMTPLMVAAECGRGPVVDFLVSKAETKLEKVNALELLGASYANDKENYDIQKAFLYLREAMHVRFSDPDNIISKEYYPLVPAYGNRVECKTLGELLSIQHNLPALHMESLAIRERILGPNNPDIPHPIIFRGAVFADSKDFDKCISLWMHAMKLRQKNKRTVSKDLLRFSQVFSQMLHIHVPLAFADVKEVFRHAVEELKMDHDKIAKADEDKDFLTEIYQENIHTCLYLLVIIMKTVHNVEDMEEFYSLVYQFLKEKPLLKNHYTPLHMAVDHATFVDDFHVNDVVKLPDSKLAQLFIHCGADVNALDSRGNTPMHILVKQNSPSDGVIKQITDAMNHLMNSDSHLDISNIEHKTAADCCNVPVIEAKLRSSMKLSLKCAAAKSLKSYGINYKSLLPPHLEEFVDWH